VGSLFQLLGQFRDKCLALSDEVGGGGGELIQVGEALAVELHEKDFVSHGVKTHQGEGGFYLVGEA
jgi:hypothetical protein